MRDSVALLDIANATVGFVGTMATHYRDAGVPFLRSLNVKPFWIDDSDLKLLDADFEATLQKSRLRENDILVVRTGEPGNCCVVPDHLVGANCSDVVIIRPNVDRVNPHYLAAYINTVGRKQISNNKVGAIQQHFNVRSAEQLRVNLPSLDAQARIAQLLNALNDAIATNNQVNDNLHAMALAQFMHQFFRKEPNGELSDVLIELPKSQVQVRDAKDADGRFPFFTSGASVLRWDEPMASGRNLLLNTGGNADVKFYVGDMAYSTDTWAVTARDGLADYVYLLLLAISPELDRKYFLGTGLRHLQKPLLKKRPIYLPSDPELRAFNTFVVPAMTMITENLRENRRLQELRDWLLPMLMNGQATVASSDKLSFT